MWQSGPRTGGARVAEISEVTVYRLQLAIALGAVAVALLVLLRRSFRVWRGRSGCGVACAGCETAPTGANSGGSVAGELPVVSLSFDIEAPDAPPTDAAKTLAEKRPHVQSPP